MPSTDQRIRILSVDDHPLLRDGIAAMIATTDDMLLVAEASTGAEAVQEFKQHRPDITLMDLQLPGINGIEAIRAIRNLSGDANIIVLTTYGGDLQSLRALAAGAASFLLKDTLRQDLLDTIRALHRRERENSLSMRSAMLKPAASPSHEASESERHAQCVAKAIAWLGAHYGEPLSGEDLARHVNMSPSSLYLHFKTLTGTTPLQYQKQLRLDTARRLILSGSIDVATAAHRVGYASVSQFTREYRRTYGESPKRDRQLLRASAQRLASALACFGRNAPETESTGSN